MLGQGPWQVSAECATGPGEYGGAACMSAALPLPQQGHDIP
jgi:hypothetical protein